MASCKCNAILIQISIATYVKLDKAYDYPDQSRKGIWESSKSISNKNIPSQDSPMGTKTNG